MNPSTPTVFGQTRINAATFILVDDDEDDLLLMRMALTQVNPDLPIIELTNGLQLLDYLKQEVDDQADTQALCLVVMDVNMPIMTGPAALQVMQTHPLWQHVPVLMMSTSDDPHQIKQLLALGAVSYVVKPKSYVGLVNQIKTIFKPWIEDCAEEKQEVSQAKTH